MCFIMNIIISKQKFLSQVYSDLILAISKYVLKQIQIPTLALP